MTERNDSPLSWEMTRSVLKDELNLRMVDPNYVWNPRIKFVRDSNRIVWARVYSKPSAGANDPAHCIGTYGGIKPSIRGGYIADGMDAVSA